MFCALLILSKNSAIFRFYVVCNYSNALNHYLKLRIAKHRHFSHILSGNPYGLPLTENKKRQLNGFKAN